MRFESSQLSLDGAKRAGEIESVFQHSTVSDTTPTESAFKQIP